LSYEIGTFSVRKEDDNDRLLRNYLLGVLPEAETERLDELSVTEEEFAQKLTIAEHDLLDAYVNGELTERELPQFQKQYSGSPHRIERVRFAQAFQLLNKTHDQTEVTRSDDSEERPTTSTASFFKFSNWTALKWGVVTSCLLLSVVASWFFVQQLRQRSPQTALQTPGAVSDSATQGRNDQEHRVDEQPTPGSAAQIDQQPVAQPATTQPANRPSPRVVAFVLKPQMRSVSPPVELTIPDDTTIVALTLQLEPSDTNDFRAILVDGSSDRTVWKGPRVKTTTSGEGSVLSIRVPAALLKPQMYRVRVIGIYPNGTEETTNEYSFRVVK
jgi:hypothetical protein